MKKMSLNDLKSAKVPQSRAFKAGLKEQLLIQAEKKYSSAPQTNSIMKTLFRLSLSFAVIVLLLTQVALPGESKDTLQMFIQKASAANEEHDNEIYHASIQMENSMYFETTNFTGWKTTSQSSKEVWLAPNKDLREQSVFTSWNGPQENGTFEEVNSQDTSLLLHDEYKNLLSYTKLQVTGSELFEKNGEIVEQAITNVHPGKQYQTNELLSQYLDQIVCVNTEDGEDFTGYTWAKISSSDPSFLEVTSSAYPKAEPSQVMAELEKAMNEGRLTSNEALKLFEQVQKDTRITYKTTQVDNHTLHHISFNRTEFLGGTYSHSPLDDYDPADVFMTYTFDGESYQLVNITSETSYNGNVTERGSYTVVSSEYLNYEENAALFKATDEFTLLSLSDAFEQDISDFKPGCYKRNEALSDEEEKAALEQLETLLNQEDQEISKAMWNRPLLANFRYYTLPGDNATYEVK